MLDIALPEPVDEEVARGPQKSSIAAMRANAGDFDQRAFGRKACRARGGLEGVGDSPASCLADRAAAFANQEHDEVVAAVIIHAGDKGVAAFDAMDEPVLAQEIERTIDRDRCRAILVTQPLDDLIGAERLVACQQRLQYLTAHRGEPLC